MPRITVLNPKTKQWDEVDDEIDVKTGKSLAREGLKAAGVPFKVSERLVHKKTRDVVDVPEDELKEALATGEFDIEALAEAKGDNYEKAQVGKYGEVGVNEAILRKTNPLSDEIGGAIESPMGALKATANYILPDALTFSESDKDLKKYRDKTELERAREDRGEEMYPLETGITSVSSAIQTPALGAKTALGRVAAGAAEGLGYAAAEDEDKTLYNSGNAAGAILGGTVSGVVEGAKGLGRAYGRMLGRKGEGTGEQYLDNPERLQDDIDALKRAETIQDSVKARNQKLDEEVLPLNEEIATRKIDADKELQVRENKVGDLENEIEQRRQLKDAIKVSSNNKEFADTAKLKDSEIALKNEKLAKENELTAIRQKQIADIDNEIVGKDKELKDFIEQSKKDTALLREDLLTSSEGKIKERLELAEKGIKEYSLKRDAKIKALELVPATESTKKAYLQLRKDLSDQIGGDTSDAAKVALAKLDEFLPVDARMSNMSEGEFMKRFLAVKKDLYSSTQTGQGYGYKNFGNKAVAGIVDKAFKEAGNPEITQYTEAMGPYYGIQTILRDYAATRTGNLTEKGIATKVFAPDPMKAEGAKKITQDAMVRTGYFPTINKEIAQFKNEKINEIKKLKLDLTNLKLKGKTVRGNKIEDSPEITKLSEGIRNLEILKNNIEKEANDALVAMKKLDSEIIIKQGLIKSTKNAPLALNDQVKELQIKRDALKANVDKLNVESNGKFLAEVQKLKNIEKLYPRKTGSQAVTEVGADVGSMVLPAGVVRAGRGVISAFRDPVRQIEMYNSVRERFRKPALTAAVRALSLSRKAVTREVIGALAEQHNVPVEELRAIMETPVE